MQAFIRVFLKAACLLVPLVSPPLLSQTPQERVHDRSHTVMPFEMSQTLHIFNMTESGGVQRVIARDPDQSDQIAMIRRHLKHEAERFQQGDFGDPAKLHGQDMPGLKELEAGASDIQVSYNEVPAGAEIIFQTDDLHLLTAIHRWFGAQLSEHGADARAE